MGLQTSCNHHRAGLSYNREPQGTPELLRSGRARVEWPRTCGRDRRADDPRSPRARGGIWA